MSWLHLHKLGKKSIYKPDSLLYIKLSKWLQNTLGFACLQRKRPIHFWNLWPYEMYLLLHCKDSNFIFNIFKHIRHSLFIENTWCIIRCILGNVIMIAACIEIQLWEYSHMYSRVSWIDTTILIRNFKSRIPKGISFTLYMRLSKLVWYLFVLIRCVKMHQKSDLQEQQTGFSQLLRSL